MEKKVIKLEKDIDRLKKAYDRYFSGVERLVPEKLAAAVARDVRLMTSTVINNTALRFRAQQAISRYQTYHVYWQKNLKEIEEGKKPRRKAGEKPEVATPESEGVLVMSGSNMDRGEMERFFSILTREYHRAGIGKTPEMSQLQKALEGQTRTIKEKFACEKVVFRVVNEEGKVRIKASPSNRGKK